MAMDKKKVMELGKLIRKGEYTKAYDLYNEIKDPNDTTITSYDEFVEKVKKD